jgi:glycerol-3-phosphate acyltransferase PlsY
MALAIIFLILSYLLGSIPFGLIIGKLSGKDLRKHGSGNIGSTNAVRTLGYKLGALSAVLDILKGALILIIIYILEKTNTWHNPLILNGESLYALYGLMAVVGHCYPVYLKFKGGKAVATSLGVLLAVAPFSALSAVIAFIICVFLTGYVSLSSTVATLVAVLTSFIIYAIFYGMLFNSLIILVFAIIIFIRHTPNYKRLLNHTEHCFKKKKLS